MNLFTHPETLSFIWSVVCGYRMNLNPTFTLCFLSPSIPEIKKKSFYMHQYVQCVSMTVFFCWAEKVHFVFRAFSLKTAASKSVTSEWTPTFVGQIAQQWAQPCYKWCCRLALCIVISKCVRNVSTTPECHTSWILPLD